MDIVYCLLMAIYLMITANSRQTARWVQRVLYALSGIMAGLAVLHVIT